MSKHLFVLLACLVVVMIGFGITLPMLPFYVERLAISEGASRRTATMHVGLLTGVYALGSSSSPQRVDDDRIGREDDRCC